MMRIKTRIWAALMLVAWAASGCGGPDRSALIATTSDTLDQGMQAFNAGEFSTAAEQLGQALSLGMVSADDAGPVGVKRTIALAKSDQLDVALVELEQLAKQAPNLDEVLAAKAFVLSKQGKRQEAAAALATAKRHNPRVQVVR